jgi:hypothetical protein
LASASEELAQGELQVGARLDLSGFRARDGTGLQEFIGKRQVCLLIVDHECKSVVGAADEMQDIYRRLAHSGIRYVVVAAPPEDTDTIISKLGRAFGITHKGEQSFFHRSAENLGFDVPAFYWSDSKPAPPALSRTPKPSHVLADSEGKVLHTWAGTSLLQSERERMANQIVSDVLQLDAASRTSRIPRP